MDSSRPVEAPSLSSDAIDFVRFCYRRRRVGWPELYDEMCAVAGRGLYRGWRFAELEEHGIGFSLHQTLELARIAAQVALEEAIDAARSDAGHREWPNCRSRAARSRSWPRARPTTSSTYRSWSTRSRPRPSSTCRS